MLHPIFTLAFSLSPFGMSKSHGTSVSEAITLVANAFGVSPEMVQLSVQGGVDSQSLGSEQPADPLEWTMPAHRSFEPPLPPPPMPPGLGPSSESRD